MESSIQTYTSTSSTDRYQANALNVGTPERWMSLLGGGLLALRGLRQGGASGILIALMGGALIHRGATGHCHLYGALGINTAQAGKDEPGISGLIGSGEAHLETAVTINRPADEVYRYWRNFENLPRFMSYLESVTVKDDDTRSHWVMKAPLGATLEWDSEITHDKAGEQISWRSVEGADIGHTGEVRFRPLPGGRGTEVKVKLDMVPPGGMAGAAAAKLVNGITEQLLHEDLRRFKRIMEAGEIPTTEGQPSGPR